MLDFQLQTPEDDKGRLAFESRVVISVHVLKSSR